MSRTTERELLEHLTIAIKERLDYGIESRDFEGMDKDQILDQLQEDSHELIDGCLPVYYSDMATLLAENTNFASVDDEGMLPENPTVWNIITASIFEWLSGEYYGLCQEVLEDLVLPEHEESEELEEAA